MLTQWLFYTYSRGNSPGNSKFPRKSGIVNFQLRLEIDECQKSVDCLFVIQYNTTEPVDYSKCDPLLDVDSRVTETDFLLTRRKKSHGLILMREKKFKESQTTKEEPGEGGGRPPLYCYRGKTTK